MRRQKRDLSHRAFIKGYQAGFNGKSKSSCPHSGETESSMEWNRGWRVGREDHWSGYNQFTGNQKAANM
ncbi:ribosome modulation factor [Porticoccaceae bacterium LTM1]|nr:ribosome modulation factor [Porticoccaceae bacterium LTM1]